MPYPSPGDLPNLGNEPVAPALQVDSLPAEPPGKPVKSLAIRIIVMLLKSRLLLCSGHRDRVGSELIFFCVLVGVL